MPLIDAVAEKEVPCKVPGCHNTWKLPAAQVVQSWTDEDFRIPKKMCSSCHTELEKLSPLDAKCSTLDCEARLTISTYQQLVLRRKGKPLEKENFFCPDCQNLLKETSDKEVPCRMKGCTHTWTWYASSQLRLGGKQKNAEPERRLCNSCFSTLKTFSSKQIPCKVKGCTREWNLDRMTQLEWKLQGKSETKRMCHDCSHHLKELTVREEPCIVQGCTHTWTWKPFAQLEFERQAEQDPSLKKPHRYCNRCFSTLHNLRPIQVPCGKHSCPHKLEYSPEQQLADIVNKRKPGQPGALCEKCQ